MIVRVFDDNDWATYYCTLCNRPFKPLHEANEHARFCGKAVPTQPVFRSYTTAATFEEDDDTQVYKKPWVGLTDEEMSDIVADIDADFGDLLWKVVCLTKIIQAELKERNT